MRVNVDNLVKSGEDTNRFYLKEVEAIPEGPFEFSEEDLIVTMTEGGSYGHTVSVTKTKLTHEKFKINSDNEIELKDVPITEILRVGEEKTRERQSLDRKWMVLGCFTEKGTQLYGYCGKINDFEGDPNADTFAVIKYSITPEYNDIEATAPARNA